MPNGKIIYLSPQEEKKSFSIEQFRANLYAIDTKFSKSYLWGVEWWYHKHLNGDSRYWDLAKTIFLVFSNYYVVNYYSNLNEEKFLPRLIQSIRKQNFSDYEIIVSDANLATKPKKLPCKTTVILLLMLMTTIITQLGKETMEQKQPAEMFFLFFGRRYCSTRRFFGKSHERI